MPQAIYAVFRHPLKSGAAIALLFSRTFYESAGKRQHLPVLMRRMFNRVNTMRTLLLVALVTIASATPIFAQLKANSVPRPTQETEGVEILTRGPIHEAFAETITFDPQEGVVVPKAPPEAIEELPPEEKPEGENVAWIAGYWAWDDEREDFLWVSGIWRALPPGRQWVPGYWAEARQGSQWISGYWADAESVEIEYLPEPPATMEVGPNIAAPSIDHRWLPGCWIWQQSRYAWRPGYWSVGQNNWTWIPAHYVWTPRGYVFVDGYYDFDTNQRGIVYAPVYFSSRVYTQRNYSYSPYVAINPVVLISHLFLRPTYGHYYFGDYYGGNYANRGYSPWYSYNSNRRGYDPFYAHQSWVHRQNQQQWQRNLEASFQNYRDNENARPPRTWDDQRARMASSGARDRQDFLIAASLDDLAKTREVPIQVQKLKETERQEIATQEKAIKDFRKERQRLESQVIAARPDIDAKQPRELPAAKVKLPKSPVVAPPMEMVAKEKAPPKRQEAPPPDMKIEPRPRKPQPSTPQPKTSREPGASPNNPKLPGETAPKLPKADLPKKDPAMDPRDAPRAEPREKPGNEPRNEPRNKPDNKPGNEPSNEPRKEPRTEPRNNPSKPPVTNPKNPPQNQPKNPKPKDPAPSPKQPMPKQPAPKPEPLKQGPPPRQPDPKQPAPKQDPPKAQAPKSEPRGNAQQPKEKPKGLEKDPEKNPKR